MHDSTTVEPPMSLQHRATLLLTDLVPRVRLVRFIRGLAEISGVACGLADPKAEWVVRPDGKPDLEPVTLGSLGLGGATCPHCEKFLAEMPCRTRLALQHCVCGTQLFTAPIHVHRELAGFLVGVVPSGRQLPDFEATAKSSSALTNEYADTAYDSFRDRTLALFAANSQEHFRAKQFASDPQYQREIGKALLNALRELFRPTYANVFVRATESDSDKRNLISIVDGVVESAVLSHAHQAIEQAMALSGQDLVEVDPNPSGTTSSAIGVWSRIRTAVFAPFLDPETGEPIGCVVVAFDQPKAFDEADREVLWATIRLIPTGAFSRPEDNSELRVDERIALLGELEDQLLSVDNADQVMDHVLRAALKLTESQAGEIVLLTEDKQRVQIRAAVGLLEPDNGRETPANLGLHGRVLCTGLVQSELDIQQHTSFQELRKEVGNCSYGDHLQKLHAAIGTPIIRTNETIGALCLARLDVRVYDARCARFANIAAKRISSALKEDSLKHPPTEKAILELTHKSLSKLADCKKIRDRLNQLLADAGMRLSKVDFVCVREYSALTKNFRYVTAEPRDQWPKDRFTQGWHRDDKSGGAFAAKNGRLYSFGRAQFADHYDPIFPDVESHLSVPVQLDDQVQLVWTLESHETDAFTSDTLKQVDRVVSAAETVLRWLRHSTALITLNFEEACVRARDIRFFSEEMARTFRDTFEVFDCAIYLLTPTGDEGELVAHAGVASENDVIHDRTGETRRRYSLREIKSLTAFALKSGNVLKIDDLNNPPSEFRSLWLDEAESPTPVDESWRVRGLLAVPIRDGKGKLLGVVRYSTRCNFQPFTLEEVENVKRLAERFGLSLERMRFTRRMEVDQKFMALSRRDMTVNKAADMLAETALRLFCCDAVHVRVRRGEELHLAGEAGKPITGRRLVTRLGEPFSGLVAAQKHIILVPDVTSDESWAQEQRNALRPGNEPWIKSMACAPMFDNLENVIGTISVHSSKKRKFAVHMTPDLEEIASHGELLLRTAIAHERELALQRAMTTASEELVTNQKVTVASVADKLGVAFTQLIPHINSSVWLYNRIGTKLQCVSTVAAFGEGRIDDRLVSAIADAPFLDKVGLSLLPEPTWFSSFDQLPDLEANRSQLAPKVNAWLDGIGEFGIVPIRFDNDNLGAIFCYADKSRGIGTDVEQRNKFKTLAAHAMLVLSTARLAERRRKAMDVTAPLAMMGALLDTFLHHLVQPVNHMRLALSNAFDRATAGMDVTSKLERLDEQLLRMEETVTDLKTFLTGRAARRTKEFDLVPSVKKCATALQSSLPKTVQLHIDTGEERLLVEGIQRVLTEALRMVIQNAVEAMPNGGDVKLRAFPRDGWVIVEISDTGVGMSEAVLNACQEPLFTTKEFGSGMGLAVARAACWWHHGELKIESQLGKGTTVQFILPGKGTQS